MATDTKDKWLKVKPKVLSEDFLNEAYINNQVQRFEFTESEDDLVTYVTIFLEDGREIFRFYNND